MANQYGVGVPVAKDVFFRTPAGNLDTRRRSLTGSMPNTRSRLWTGARCRLTRQCWHQQMEKVGTADIAREQMIKGIRRCTYPGTRHGARQTRSIYPLSSFGLRRAMNDRGGYLNGSGYPDPTAYKAIILFANSELYRKVIDRIKMLVI